MKKIILVILTLAIIFATCSCTKTTTRPGGDDSTTKYDKWEYDAYMSEDTYKAFFDFYIEYDLVFEEMASFSGIEVIDENEEATELIRESEVYHSALELLMADVDYVPVFVNSFDEEMTPEEKLDEYRQYVKMLSDAMENFDNMISEAAQNRAEQSSIID